MWNADSQGQDITPELFRQILDATHQGDTQYSYICDLRKQRPAEDLSPSPRWLLPMIATVTCLTAAGHLLFFALPFVVPQLLVYGPPRDLYYANAFQSAVLLMPWVTLLLTMILIPLTAAVWSQRLGPKAGRFLVAASLLFSMASLMLYGHWRMLHVYW